MTKSVPLLLVLFGILLCGLNYGTVHANLNDTAPSIEERFAEVGYISVKEAVKEFEKHFTYEVK